MAHSFVQAHDDEISAFARFADANPGNVVLLIDTYETEAAAEKVVRLAPKLKQRGINIQGVRIDNGNLGQHACKVRAILDEAGLREVGSVATLQEWSDTVGRCSWHHQFPVCSSGANLNRR